MSGNPNLNTTTNPPASTSSLEVEAEPCSNFHLQAHDSKPGGIQQAWVTRRLCPAPDSNASDRGSHYTTEPGLPQHPGSPIARDANTFSEGPFWLEETDGSRRSRVCQAVGNPSLLEINGPATTTEPINSEGQTQAPFAPDFDNLSDTTLDDLGEDDHHAS